MGDESSQDFERHALDAMLVISATHLTRAHDATVVPVPDHECADHLPIYWLAFWLQFWAASLAASRYRDRPASRREGKMWLARRSHYRLTE
jgi:hypothetical protein